MAGKPGSSTAGTDNHPQLSPFFHWFRRDLWLIDPEGERAQREAFIRQTLLVPDEGAVLLVEGSWSWTRPDHPVFPGVGFIMNPEVTWRSIDSVAEVIDGIDGIEGLVRLRDLSGPLVDAASDAVRVDDELTAVVTGIDRQAHADPCARPPAVRHRRTAGGPSTGTESFGARKSVRSRTQERRSREGSAAGAGPVGQQPPGPTPSMRPPKSPR
ncbi:hypothetical protein ACH4FA_11790 [Streptomyces sp. NPDC017966]|uniref:hypothetical protein n=1 Tax=Streptomyces sp. NPDC017966 TaxID=3365023 RepID=UPI00379239BA